MTVGFDVVDKLNKVKHNHPMLSLDKTKSVEEVQKFIGNKPILTMLKMDGLTISVKYSEGKLISAETRGNGAEGEDVTHNALVFTNLPQTISYRGDLVVDGEAIITYEDFEKINANLPEGEKYKNPRNLVSGSVRQLDSGIAAQRHIQFVAWKLVSAIENHLKVSGTFSERLNWLETLGFTVVPRLDRFDERSINFLKIIADKYSYPIDGLVVSFDDVEYLESLGATSHHLRGQLAFKFYDETAITILRDIEWNTSRSGLVNPIAIFDEVDISGSTISKATLHNLSYIKSLELGIGDEIEIYKANDIIPKVANNLTRTNSYKRPLLCKSCGVELEVHNDNGSETLHCPNEECPARMLDKFVHFVSKNGMDIQGLSEATLEKFISNGWIKKFSDIYRLSQYKNEIITLDGFGQKSWDRLWQSIQDSRNTTMAKFICALGIPLIGKNTAKEVAKYCQINEFGELDIDMSDTSVFTPSVIASFQTFGWKRENQMEISALIYELNIANEQKEIESSPFTGKTIVVTGALNYYTRTTIQEEIERLGAKMGSSVSKKTDFLLTNEKSGSSKYKKAVELGIKIINEEEFEKMKG
jgi:DNA ligase (NAD+)